MSVGSVIVVNDRMQSGYKYILSSAEGAEFDEDFTPFHSPQKMLELGVFEGRYCNDCRDEFPSKWFRNAGIRNEADPSANYFGEKSRQSLHVWRQKGWIYGPDPRGWFQWYCRYWLGRRLPQIDRTQIQRWRSFRRHAAQVRANCRPGDCRCRPRQRQALLQWAYNPFI